MRRTVAVALGLVAVGATGVGALALGGDAGTGTATATTATTTTTTTVRPPAVTRATAPTTDPPATTTSPSATTTTTTIVPIVTYAADIGILSPVAVAAPAHLAIPALEVDGPVLATGVNGAGELDIPPDARTLVWYRHGPTPGAAGSAVVAGHLNWKGVQGVFAELADVPVGAEIVVTYDDLSQRSFVVQAVELVDKPAVAINGVFARDGESVLRLVTCGGDFDDSTRHYRSNVIVTAVPA